jgi:hypothetical protein
LSNFSCSNGDVNPQGAEFLVESVGSVFDDYEREFELKKVESSVSSESSVSNHSEARWDMAQ